MLSNAVKKLLWQVVKQLSDKYSSVLFIRLVKFDYCHSSVDWCHWENLSAFFTHIPSVFLTQMCVCSKFLFRRHHTLQLCLSQLRIRSLYFHPAAAQSVRELTSEIGGAQRDGSQWAVWWNTPSSAQPIVSEENVTLEMIDSSRLWLLLNAKEGNKRCIPVQLGDT